MTIVVCVCACLSRWLHLLLGGQTAKTREREGKWVGKMSICGLSNIQLPFCVSSLPVLHRYTGCLSAHCNSYSMKIGFLMTYHAERKTFACINKHSSSTHFIWHIFQYLPISFLCFYFVFHFFLFILPAILSYLCSLNL